MSPDRGKELIKNKKQLEDFEIKICLKRSGQRRLQNVAGE